MLTGTIPIDILIGNEMEWLASNQVCKGSRNLFIQEDKLKNLKLMENKKSFAFPEYY